MWLSFTNQTRLPAAVLATALLLAGCATSPHQTTTSPAQTSTTSRVTRVDTESAFRAAVNEMQHENWHAAAERLQAITAQDPQLPGAWVNLGIAHVQLGDAAAAEADFHHALELNAQHAESWNQLGMLYRRSNRLEDAQQAYLEALKAAPDHVDAHWNLAILYDRFLPDPAQALAHYTRYQQLTQSTDPQLQQWIAGLQEQLPEPVNMTAGVSK
jgi:tetratricopeptide (TPR) repeat protein